MAKRKTIKVDDLTRKINDMILHSPDDSKQRREGLMAAIESVLHDTGNYEGFNYLTADMMKRSKNGESVGINREHTTGDKFDNTDNTRVYYYF